MYCVVMLVGKIRFYQNNGRLDHEEILNEENLTHINGMITKCYLNDDESEIVGYADPYRTHDDKSYDRYVHDYINLWTWDNVDEEKKQLIGDIDTKYNQTFKKVDISNIKNIDVILFSSQRWGGRFTNKFEFSQSIFNVNKVDIPFLFKRKQNCDFEYTNDRYNIVGFTVNNQELEQYTIIKQFGIKDEEVWLFNINNNLISFCNSGNYKLDSYSVKILDNNMHVVTDFDYYNINLDSLDCIVHIELDSTGPYDEVYQFYKGILLIGEMNITYIENKNIIWEYNSSSYIESALVCNDNSIEVIENEPYRKFCLNKNGKIL